ncbi:protein PALS2-like isoform X1 [Macrosteles quadrilineatus]|uniref:protein PALS2-like isoform X1 n=2 Tax=Macrosteles quadrilineatus TaxID=74068 RepID=UPI0023E34EB6|nr:protein PALS2-like isoform X1 [Macrosteles quadrilineatus]
MVFGRKTKVDTRELLASQDQMETSFNGKTADNEAFLHVRDNMDGLDANETDLLFLRQLLDNTVLRNLVQVQDQLEVPQKLAPDPVVAESVSLVSELQQSCQTSPSHEAKELNRIFHKPHFKALLETHDRIAEKKISKRQLETKPKISELSTNGKSEMNTQPIRIVGLRKVPKEPLGFTVQVDENGNLIVARVLAGGVIERQGLLHPGDVILEVNNVAVTSPDELQFEVMKAKENVTLRIAPNPENAKSLKTHQCYMRALFDYDPKEDTLLPCREIGLAFQHGDILQIMNTKDPNWWQAKKVGQDGPAGLVPSQELEERRKAFVKPEADFVHKISICGTRISKKKRKQMYESKMNSEFDKAELLLYEEVTRMPPFKRRTLALVGTHGVGRRTLKNRLINSDPDKFAAVIPMTSRPQRELEENGENYWFSDRESMERDIREHKFLEYGEHNGHLYGTSLDTIRDVIRQGKMCILDCSPAALKMLHNSSEFMPFVIFIAAPGMELLKQLYNFNRSTGTSSRNLTFDRQSSIRYSSRRARTLESLASLYEEDDLRRTVEESCSLQRAYEKYIDLVIVNEDFDQTFREVVETLDNLSTEHQWVPVNWVY